MGADDYHVSVEHMDAVRLQKKLQAWKKIEHLAYKWFDGEIAAERMAEAVFGLVNGV